MQDNELHWQDEILQVMYWMRGEGLGESATPEQLNRFLNLKPSALETALQRLLAHRLICVSTGDGSPISYQLTERGLEEGKRRFVDEFVSYLGHESHIECSDPNCDCHTSDWDGICHTSQVH
ncbi:hypothetical protein [Candidatus Entotheonella palauensis]|uniref:HTH hxlR-type domain-containing protein n=1 Tax=Candidatus Entotheonella gemina TaxID=1429439 RepID=W4MBD6_9BACT|nr:hypothetical protein [Candidatus Entotheonella palauensis]ETX07518.1 MAG: hypothetical protein ETSY2_10770 [Candidatus Entotheonella gemina]